MIRPNSGLASFDASCCELDGVVYAQGHNGVYLEDGVLHVSTQNEVNAAMVPEATSQLRQTRRFGVSLGISTV